MKCLFCYSELAGGEKDFHSTCSKKFFGTAEPPPLDLSKAEIYESAVQLLGKRMSVTGVQPKLSVDLEKQRGRLSRLTMVGLWGRFILKPPFDEYPEMPEIEDVTMHMAEELKIKTARHSLIRMKSGELAYITGRFDRSGKEKFHVEDMAQLAGELTENKYRGSIERVGRLIYKYSDYPGLDAAALFELTLFCFITGNSDMHLKNFSLITDKEGEVHLSPAYDLLSTKLLLPEDPEEIALTLSGKKKNLRKEDFDLFGEKLHLNKNTVSRIYGKFFTSRQTMNSWIDKSFLSPGIREKYIGLINKNISVFEK